MITQAKSDPQANNLLNHRLLSDYVLVLPMDFDEDDTIVNPRQYEDKPEWGIVIQVGPGRMTEQGILVPPAVSPGDIIVFGAYASTTIRSHGHDFFSVRADDIVSVYGRA